MSAYSRAAAEAAGGDGPHLNRERLNLLRAIHAGRVTRNPDGLMFITWPTATIKKARCERKVAELAGMGLVDLDALKLTPTGLAAIGEGPAS